MSEIKHIGECYCGSIQFEVSGDAAMQAICHCTFCRGWSASPVNGVTAFPAGSMTITKGKEHLKTFAKTEGHYRSWCEKCGGHVFSDHPPYGIIDVYASVLKGFDWKPEVHLNYESTIMPMKDGLPKFKDMPADLGGSGDMVEE